ncbi:MAG TPA: hypothetical protein VN641_20705 [Urbifossiella sp.]|nr:hypothetical protein [Urbifossiella sp.]
MIFRFCFAVVAAALILPAALLADDKPKPKTVDYEAELNDKLAKGIEPDKNACALLWKCFGPHPEGTKMPAEYFRRLGIAQPPEKGDYFLPLGELLKNELQLDPSEFNGVYDQQGWASARPWAAKDYPYIALWLTKNEKPLAVAREATKRPQYYNPLVSRKNDKGQGALIGALLPSVQKCRELTNAFCARAMLRLGEGKKPEAWADLLACHRLARHTGRGGTLIEALVGYATEAIASGAELAYLENAKLSAKQIQECLKDLQNLPPLPGIADKVDLMERYTFKDSINMIRNGGIKVLEGLDKDVPTEEEINAFAKLDWTPALKNADKLYDRMVAALRQPTRAERLQGMDLIEKDLDKLKKENQGPFPDVVRMLLGKNPGDVVVKRISDILITLLVPAIRRMNDAHDRVEQVHVNLQLAFALAAYRADNNRYPAKLDDLAPKYAAKIPLDLFDNMPLKYKPSDKGYLLYSVGPNGQDEGGRWRDDSPPGDDPRVRMPLPPLKKE